MEGTADAREDTGASLRGSCLARPRRALGEGGQGEVRVVPSALVTRSGQAPRGRAPEEEEGDRRGRRSGDEGDAGSKDRERRAGRQARGQNVSLPVIWPLGRTGAEGGGSGRPGRESAPRRGASGRAAGTLWALPGAGSAARRRRERRSRVPRETAPVSQLLPPPPPQGWRRAGVGASERHSEFPATFPAGGKRAVARRSQDRGQE